MSVAREELRKLVDDLPEREMHAVKRFMEFVISRNRVWDALDNAPEDDEPLDEDDLKAIDEGMKAIARGKFKPLKQVKKELGL